MDLNINIKLTCDDYMVRLVDAVVRSLDAIDGAVAPVVKAPETKPATAPAPAAHPDYVAEKIPAKDTPIKLAPGSTVVIQNNNPAAPIPTATPVVPAAPAKTYTLDDLITAAAPLLDAGKFDEMTALTRKYGADSFMAIKESDFGSVAADLRALGAKL